MTYVSQTRLTQDSRLVPRLLLVVVGKADHLLELGKGQRELRRGLAVGLERFERRAHRDDRRVEQVEREGGDGEAERLELGGRQDGRDAAEICQTWRDAGSQTNLALMRA